MQNSELLALLRSGTPGIDFRAPAEYAKGHLPHSINLPILDDEQRREVGRTYRLQGPEAARKLGHKRVSGSLREARIQSWITQLKAAPNTYCYCWRGGERSQIAAAWLAEAGFAPLRVPGGYKALRHLCLATLVQFAEQQACQWQLLGGRTGSGKTDLLKRVPWAIDLEGLANHRGSAFGRQASPQPALASFENALAAGGAKTPTSAACGRG